MGLQCEWGLFTPVAEPGHFQWGGQDGTSDHFGVALKSLLYEHKNTSHYKIRGYLRHLQHTSTLFGIKLVVE